MKKHAIGLILAACSLLLSGFTLRPPDKAGDRTLTLRVTTAVRSSGSGTVKLELTPSASLVEYLHSKNISENQFCYAVESYVQSGFNYTIKMKNSGFQCVGTASFQGLDALESLMEDNLGSGTIQRLEIKDKRFYYEARINIDTSYLSSSEFTVEAFWVLVLPGTPGENNADTVSGNTLTWDLSTSNGSADLSAESALGGDVLGMNPSTLAVLLVLLTSCCCVILLLAAGIAAFLLLRRKNPSAAEESSADATIPVC
jgi:hypothetical protein